VEFLIHHQNILGLDVPMNNTTVVLLTELAKISEYMTDSSGMAYQVFDTLEQLSEQLARLIFTQLLLQNNVIEKLSLRCQLQHEEDGAFLVESVLQTQDIGMANTHQDSNLLLQAVRLRAFLHSGGFGEDFDGVSLSCGFFDAEEDFSKVALA
jgi:hypothetical protein